MVRFNEECIEVFNLTVSLAIMTLLKGTRDEHFKRSLSKNGPKTMTKVRLRVEKYINFDEAMQIVDDLDYSNLGIIGEAMMA